MAKQNKNVVSIIGAGVSAAAFAFPTSESMAANKSVVEVVAPAVTKVEPIQTVAAVKKSHLAQAVFDDCYKQQPVPARKDIIAKLVAEADLTPAGAATYLQNMKKKAGLVKSAAPMQAAA